MHFYQFKKRLSIMECKKLNNWPVLKSYTGEQLRRIAMPLGGIGTGTISLSGRGGLIDWELMNSPAKKFIPNTGKNVYSFSPCFTVRYETASGQRAAKLLEGPLLPEEYEGGSGCGTPNHGLPRFRECLFHTAYPLAQVEFIDQNFAPKIALQAFNPLIPADSDNSGLPVVVMRWLVANPTDEEMTVSICASMINFVGRPGNENLPEGAEPVSSSFSKENLQGIQMSATGLNEINPAAGTFAFCTDSDGEISQSTRIVSKRWNVTRLEFWDRFLGYGDVVDSNDEGDLMSAANLCTKVKIPANSKREINFYLTWHFPNRITWTPHDEPEDVVGNYYCTKYSDAVDAAAQIIPKLPGLEETTVKFVEAFCSSDLPEVVKEAALFNLSTLRTETCFRTKDGRFYGYEGVCDCSGCCHGSCTHVWNYEHATAFMFGDLAKCMREIEFDYATADNGLMSFRVHLPLKYSQEFGSAAADGQMGCIMKIYRDWQLCGDDAWLKKLWPKVRKSLEFCWIEGGWDADKDGVMEGCQHNTMDVEYYGPNPQMTIWYLGALRAAEEMAAYLGEEEFAAECRKVFESGSRKADEIMFNGEYYEHIIEAPKGEVAKGLRHTMGASDPANPDFQLGAGCLVDQLVGQYTAHILGLGYLTDKENVHKTLKAILKHNHLDNFQDHFNPMRDYVLGNESALLMAGYPEGKRPKAPFPYFAEVMTGFEHTVAIHMLYEGMTDEGLKVMSDVRERYDGARRNPFDEAECGHHYARAMASWAAINALTGFQYSAVDGTMTFDAPDGTYFWSTGHAWGTVNISNGKTDIETLYKS
jgi:uncharacterized protein (DUF608 family)